MAGSSIAKTILIPPLIALAIYILSIYVFLPIYRSRQRYAQYLPMAIVPDAGSESRLGGLISRTRDRASDLICGSQWWRRRGSAASGDSMFGDEELEEGFNGGPLEQEPVDHQSRRLSRDLEVGFRDDSDDEEEVGGIQRGSGSRSTAS